MLSVSYCPSLSLFFFILLSVILETNICCFLSQQLLFDSSPGINLGFGNRCNVHKWFCRYSVSLFSDVELSNTDNDRPSSPP